MKKIIALAIATTMVFAIAACGDTATETSAVETVAETEAAVEETEAAVEETEAVETEAAEESVEETEAEA